jgi:hypothetical protein
LLTDIGVGGDSNQKELSNLEVFDSENRKYLKLLEGYRKSGFLDKFNSPALFIPLLELGVKSLMQEYLLIIFKKKSQIIEED